MSQGAARGVLAAGLAWVAVLAGGRGRADSLELIDGTVLEHCFVRDEGVRYLVWEKMHL